MMRKIEISDLGRLVGASVRVYIVTVKVKERTIGMIDLLTGGLGHSFYMPLREWLFHMLSDILMMSLISLIK